MNCQGKQCPSHKDCFYYLARRRVHNAQILIVNHALFFSDLALRRAARVFCPTMTWRSSTKPTSWKRSPATTWAFTLRPGKSSTCWPSCTTSARSRGLLVHHKLAEAQQQVQIARLEADDFFADVADWATRRGKTTLRVTKPEIVDNR